MLWTRTQAVCAPTGLHHTMDHADWATAEALHERYLDEVFRYVLRRVPSVPEAEDITAEVFGAAAAGLRRFKGHCSPYLWLLGIARRKIADSLRRRERRRESLVSELADDSPEADPLWETLVAIEGPEAAVVRAEARRVVRGLIEHLSHDQREAILLQYMEQLSVAEIAQVMGRSVPSVTHPLTWPQICDGRDWRSGLYRQLGTPEIPHTILVDRQGSICAVGLHGDALRQAVAELVAMK